MSNDGLELVINRNAFYRDNYRRVVIALLIMIFINLGLVGAVFYLITHRPTPQYFATTASGRILPLYPLDQPMMSQAEILQWASVAATLVFNFDFVHWRSQLQEASEYFTPDGWQAFEQVLKSSNNLQTVLDKKLTVNAVATGAPVVQTSGVINGRCSWNVQIPLLITYQSASVNFQQPVLVNMLIIRIPVVNNPKGIAIAQFIASVQPIDEALNSGGNNVSGP